MIISAIVAYSQNFCIGKENKVPWHLPADLRDFKTKTMGHIIVMGRKTYESIGRVLPGRPNIVLSKSHKNELEAAENLFFYDNFTAVIKEAEARGETELFIIGGGEIYRHLLPFCHRVYATEVRTIIPDGDTFFPDLANFENWKLVDEIRYNYDDKNAFDYKFLVWENVNPLPYI